MDIVRLTPELHFFRFPVGHVYLWEDADGLTLIDSGAPGAGARIAEGILEIGHHPGDVRRLVLTHGHIDHVGGAAEIASWGDVTVYAHRADAPAVRGEAEMPPADLSDWERPIFERANKEISVAALRPVRVDREVEDGDVIGFGGGARVVPVPGHTAGSVVLHLPAYGVLFTGDIAARDPGSDDPDTPVFPGVFNVDPPQALDSFRRVALLETEIACFGHGEPVAGGASARFREAVGRLS
ncbi:MBL fold metallo-hydrolase [Spongiactinospora sp. TRM90649]|uniref:MBL fold metallo-hydrolase n=1 Tax=Spongiactinospora sp. TRM90649 TaxID=3031114 RepID=UPI0023F6496F|nr:MBL fold metallo-hydrolase [Spongiactinospora sp. TRM90649]MDF5759307.1 MBL fold metallo-hydrolase [Spongiactinospora sp. TRM90649]